MIDARAQGFLAEGLQRTSAGLGSVIIDSQPLTVAALAALLFGERLRPLGVAGLGVGVAGLALLEVPPDALAGARALPPPVDCVRNMLHSAWCVPHPAAGSVGSTCL